MRLRTFPGLLAIALVAIGLAAYSTTARHNEGGSSHQQPGNQTDPISGDWDASFFVNGTGHPSKFELKLEGTKVTGTALSDHTGPGTVRDGVWSEGKLGFTLDFKKHESIVIKGALKEGKLAGEFTTEGFTSTWEATRK